MKDYELLEAQARMMRMAEKHGIDDWRKLVRCSGNNVYWCTLTGTNTPIENWNHHKFALGVVEGKPVFEGSTGWSSHLQRNVTVTGQVKSGWVYENVDGCFSVDDFSWNPPTPKTVMVELTVEDVEYWAKCGKCFHEKSDDFYESCRKALESIKS